MVEWRCEFVTGMAEAMTGRKGYDALRQFSKQLTLGAIRAEGDENLEDVFAQELVSIFGMQVLTRMTWANDASRYRWVFDERWVQDPNAWQAHGCDGVVLIGMDDDAEFFFVAADEASALLKEWKGVLTIPMSYDGLARWGRQWLELNREVRDGPEAR